MGNVVILVMGFMLLVIGADKFVEGTSAFARRLHIPPLIIGLTIVAFGTSAPELAVSLVAGLQGSNEIAIGNVLGSNIFNLLVVIGSSALVAPLIMEETLLRRDWTASIAGTILLGGLLLKGNALSRIDALVLLLAFAFIMGIQIRDAGKEKKVCIAIPTHEENQRNDSEADRLQEISKKRIVIYIGLGLIVIILGGQLAVNGASGIARIFQISETIIGLTVVAIGTSLPELVTSIVATRRGENSIAIGNVIGSNIFNILFILGISALCTPISVDNTAIYDTMLLILISIVLILVAKKGTFHGKYHRRIGGIMIAAYIMYTAWIIIR